MTDSIPLTTAPLMPALPEIKQEMYATLPAVDLVVFSVYSLQADGRPAAVEEIVSACFRLFPSRFSLRNYFYWPDSALILSHLREAKEKGDLKSHPTDGFGVKVKGRQTARKTAGVLGIHLPAPAKKKASKKVNPIPAPAETEKKQPAMQSQAKALKKRAPAAAPILKTKPTVSPVKKASGLKKKTVPPAQSKTPVKTAPTPKTGPPKRRPATPQPPVVPVVEKKVSKEEKLKAGRFVQAMERSDAYRHYKKNGEAAVISEFDFRSLLLCTMESPAPTLARNVNTFKEYARLQNRRDLEIFLQVVEKRFSGLLNSLGKKKTAG